MTIYVNPDLDSAVCKQLAGCRILGAMRIKNEEQWIRKSIESQLPICDKVLVLDDSSTDGTRDILREFGSRVVMVESPFTGVNEGRDKRFILAQLCAANPEWTLWIDGDEVLENLAPVLLRHELQDQQAAAFAFRICYFWDSTERFRVDGVYANFHRFSMFRVRGQNPTRLHFPTTGSEADLHCGGNAPAGLIGSHYFSGVRVKHYGYLTQEMRQRKFDWYNKIDPNNEAEDCYRHIIETPGARHAPGPTQFEEWIEPDPPPGQEHL